MNKEKMQEFKELLLKLKSQIINGGILRSTEDLTISSDDLPDEADLANSVITQQVTFNMRQRELNKLRSIDNALQRIQEGTYGFCDDCDEEIEYKRLKNQAWATLCITHAEEREREQDRSHRAV